MTVPGVLLESTPGTSWAWIGVRVRPAQKMSETSAYPDVDESQRLTRTITREQAWLTSLWTTDAHARWELRYRSDPATKLLSCTILGRVEDDDPRLAVEAAVRLRDRLTDSPAHVRTDPLLDVGEVKGHLVPGARDGRSTVEVRKRLTSSACTRPETRRRFCFAVSPLRPPEDRSWEPLWRELTLMPEPTVLSVYLEPYRPSPVLVDDLRRLAAEYAYLARPGAPSPVWSQQVEPDGLAVHAAPLYARAAAAYASGPCFRTRISVASQGPLGHGFAELAAAVTGGGVACPPPPWEQDAFWRNFGGLNRDWLEHTYGQGGPVAAMRDTERILCDLSDVDEAALTFRLPYQVTSHLPLFER
ncbi:hypothetical protein ACFWNN_09020 [Lentzea sp. NPDC058450]|uniref:hypothetical protein n=1 Tax=Lentzea sp. NPDC058450 TaxID=3346505 RepID=UPI00365B4F9E